VDGPGNLLANYLDETVIFGHNLSWPFSWSEKFKSEEVEVMNW
jgi:hypothetical protein